MKLFSFLFVLVNAFIFNSVQGKRQSRCEIVLTSLQKQGEVLARSFEAQQYSKTTVQGLVLQQFLKTVEAECPVMTEEVSQTTYTAPFDCEKTSYEFIEVLKGDMVSNYQKIKEIINFQANECLPYHFQSQSLEHIKEEIGQKLLNSTSTAQNTGKSSNMLCAGCGFGITLLSDYIDFHGLDITKFIEEKLICRILPGKFKKACDDVLDVIGPILIEMLTAKENSDVICQAVGACNGWEQCKLHPGEEAKQNYNLAIGEEQKVFISEVLNAIAPVEWIKELIGINKSEEHAAHLPKFDLDKDRFSEFATLRGYDWRGKDCNEFNKHIHPGRKTKVGKKGADYNCNGIHGVDSSTGVPLKNKLCDGSGQLGVVTIGDSAGAHFSLPPQWLNVSDWNNHTFNGFIPKLMNELDLPQFSGGTGWNETETYASLYLKFLKKNRCNRNDFQNLGVNGACSRDEFDNMIAIARDQKDDHPVFILWELIGNDVCGHVPSEMTSPEDFRVNIKKLWKRLDETLPKGSHMVVSGVADGRILYECLQHRKQPLGIPYPVFYDYLVCLQTGPCAGWMNSNATARNETSKRAAELNVVYQEIIASEKYENFDIQYYDTPIKEMFTTIEEVGGHCWDVIEPSDGFHPNGIAQGFWADIFWKYIERDHPEWLGKENPHNQEIIERFGNGTQYHSEYKNEKVDVGVEMEEEVLELL